MDINFYKNAYDEELIKEVLTKGRVTTEADGKVKIVHTLANSVSAVVELQVKKVLVNIKDE